MRVVRTGVTRDVIIAFGLAFKIPTIRYGWKNYLHGLLCNMQEVAFGTARLDGFCPVVWSLAGGFLVVMPEVQVLTEPQYEYFGGDDYFSKFCEREEYHIPAELKCDSFGLLMIQGRAMIVAIDYGS